MKYVVLGIFTMWSVAVLAETNKGSLMIERLNPQKLHPPVGQSLMVVSSARRLAFFTANALDAQGNLVGANDFAAQNRKIAENISVALQELDADATNIIKLTAYVVNYDAGVHGPLIAAALADNPPDYPYPATMLVSVAGLAHPGFLLEIEVLIGLD